MKPDPQTPPKPTTGLLGKFSGASSSPLLVFFRKFAFMRNLLAWAGPLRIITAIVLLGLLAIGGNWLADWRAERRWQIYRDAARARGVKMTRADFIPPEIPDSENFAALPMFRALQPRKLSSRDWMDEIFSTSPQSPMSLLTGQGGLPRRGNPVKGERLDWKEWRQYFQRAGWVKQTSDNAARDVLAALERYAPEISEWGQWRTRPRSRFPAAFDVGQAVTHPHLLLLGDAALLFALRMRAHLDLRDSGAAYEDFRQGLQGYMALRDEPGVLSGLVRMSILTELIDAVGEGLAARRWAEPDLRNIEKDLTGIRMGDDYRLAFSSTRGFANAGMDELANDSPWKRKELFSKFIRPVLPLAWMIIVVPRWFFRDNQLRMNRDFDELIARVSPDGSTWNSDAPNPSGPEHIAGPLQKYHLWLALNGTAPFANIEKRYIRAEDKLREARLACAAERFRMANGAFPETLAELVPAFSAENPIDIYSGRPMIYRQKGRESFLLYSVGPNRVDDHGVIDPKHTEKHQSDDIWLYAPTGAP